MADEGEVHFQLEYRDDSGELRHLPLMPSNSQSILDALPLGLEARVITPNGAIWSVATMRAALHEAVGELGVSVPSPFTADRQQHRRTEGGQ